jgi:protein phosphatase
VTTTPWPKLAVAQRTDPGREPAKQVNEDAVLYQETALGHLLVVCDGMGGHSSGREASHLAVAVIARELAGSPAAAPPHEALRNAVVSAGRHVFSLGGIDNNPARPGSTCVALLVHPGGTEVAHIGDSRAYLVRKGQLWPLTRDHSMVQQMVDAGLLRAEEAAAHPDSNKITRALGMRPDSEVELRLEPMLQEARDLFVLITDGVSDVIADNELQAMAAVAAETGKIEAFCEQVISLANARGGPDNCTVQAAYVLDAGVDMERVQARAPVPTQVDLDGPLALDLDTMAGQMPAAIAEAASGGPPPAAAAPAPALERGPQRTVPLAMLPAGYGAPPPGVAPSALAPSPAAFGPPAQGAPAPTTAFGPPPPAFGGAPVGQAPTTAFGAAPTGQPTTAFGAAPIGQAPTTAFGASPAQPPAPLPEAKPAGSRATGGRVGGTVSFSLTPAAGLPAAGLPVSGAGAPPAASAPTPPVVRAAPPPTRDAPKRRWGLIAFGFALFTVGALLVGAVVWWLLNEDEEPPALPEAPAPTQSAVAPAEAAPTVPTIVAPPQATGAPPRAQPSASPPAVRAPPRGAAPPASVAPNPPPRGAVPPASIVPSPPPPKTPAPVTPPTR